MTQSVNSAEKEIQERLENIKRIEEQAKLDRQKLDEGLSRLKEIERLQKQKEEEEVDEGEEFPREKVGTRCNIWTAFNKDGKQLLVKSIRMVSDKMIVSGQNISFDQIVEITFSDDATKKFQYSNFTEEIRKENVPIVSKRIVPSKPKPYDKTMGKGGRETLPDTVFFTVVWDGEQYEVEDKFIN